MSTQSSKCIRIGTRESNLARLQTQIVTAKLTKSFPGLDFEVHPITTGGDKVLDRPIAALGGSGVFVKELEEALLADEVDMVVHSLKDLPTQLPEGLVLACVPERDEVRDVLVAEGDVTLAGLPEEARVATSSRRRAAQIKALRPDLEFVDIRGNVPTRIKKFEDGQCDAMILAGAGLIRLGLRDKISDFFDPEACTPAVGQGALAVECRGGDERILSMLKQIENQFVRAQVEAERAMLDQLGGGCSVPVGGLARTRPGNLLSLIGCVASLDGKTVIRTQMEGPISDPERLGVGMAIRLIDMGAGKILEALRQDAPNVISPP